MLLPDITGMTLRLCEAMAGNPDCEYNTSTASNTQFFSFGSFALLFVSLFCSVPSFVL